MIRILPPRDGHIDRLLQMSDKGVYLAQPLQNKLIEHRQDIDKHGEHSPEMRNWKRSLANPGNPSVNPASTPVDRQYADGHKAIRRRPPARDPNSWAFTQHLTEEGRAVTAKAYAKRLRLSLRWLSG